jgi:hypothetical protein
MVLANLVAFFLLVDMAQTLMKTSKSGVIFRCWHGASLANVGKNICFLLASASRGSINMRFAKRNNMGDISGKSVS